MQLTQIKVFVLKHDSLNVYFPENIIKINLPQDWFQVFPRPFENDPKNTLWQ